MKKIIISICLILVAFSVCFFVPKTNSVNAEATIETAEENSIKVFSGTNNVSLVGKEGDGKLSLFEELIQCETSNEPVMFYRNGTLYKNQYVIQKATTDHFSGDDVVSTGKATIEIPSSIQYYLNSGKKVFVSASVGHLGLSNNMRDQVSFALTVDENVEEKQSTKYWNQSSNEYIPNWIDFSKQEITKNSTIIFEFESGERYGENTSKGFYIFNPTITFTVENFQSTEDEITIEEIVIKNKGYDGTTKAEIDHVVLSGISFNENLSISGLSVEFNSSLVGATPIISGTPVISGTEKTLNQDYSSAKITGTILKRDVVVKASQTSKEYISKDETKIEYETFNILDGESLEGELSREEAGSDFSAGKYRIVLGTLNNPNYNIIFHSNVYEIIKTEIILESIEINKDYDGTNVVENDEIEVNIGIDTNKDGEVDVYFNLDQNGFLKDKQENQTKYLESESLHFEYTYFFNEINAGEYPISVTVPRELTGTSANSFYLNTRNYTTKATINQIELTIKVDNKTKIYGDVDPELTYSIIEGSLVGTETLKGNIEREQGENVGEYEINIGTLKASNPNYQISIVNGVLTIQKREIELEIFDAEKEYGEADPTFEFNITKGNLIGNDRLNIEIVSNSNEEIGEYELTLKTTNEGEIVCNSNYLIVAYEKGVFKINKNLLTITIEIDKKVYDGTNNATYKITYETTSLDFNSNETKIDKDKLVAKFSDANIGKKGVILFHNNAELQSLTPDIVEGEEKNNYNIEIKLNDDNAIITKREAKIVVFQNYEKQYLEPDPTFLFRQENVVEGESLTGGLSREQGELPGEYKIILGTITEENNPNYTISIDEKYLTINKREVQIEVESLTKVYGENDPTPTLKLSTERNLGANSITLNILIGTPAREAGENIGQYKYSQGSISLTPENENLFSIVFVETGILKILQREIKIKINDVKTSYGDQEFSLTYEVDPSSEFLPLSTDDIKIEPIINAKEAKVYDLKAVASENYAIIPVYIGKLTVEKAKITIKPTAQSKIYGNQIGILKVANEFEVETGEIFYNDKLIISGNFERANIENVGIYDITEGDAVYNENYEVTFKIEQCFEIKRRPIVVTAQKVYYYLDIYEQAYKGIYELILQYDTPENIVEGDALQGKLKLDDEIKGVGKYVIGQGTLTNELNPNYDIEFVPGFIEIRKREIYITSFHTNVVVEENRVYFENSREEYKPATKIYDGTTNLPEGVTQDGFTCVIVAREKFINDKDSDEIFSLNNISLTCEMDKNVGSYPIKIEFKGLTEEQTKTLEAYYNVVVQENPINVLQREVTLTIVGKEFLYGGVQPSAKDLVVLFEKESYENGEYDKKGILISKDENGDPKTDSNGNILYEVGFALEVDKILRDSKNRILPGEYKIEETILQTNSNYKITVERDENTSGYFIVKKRKIKIDINSHTKTYGDPDPTLTYVITGDSILEGDAIKGQLIRHEGESVGIYEIVNDFACYNSEGEINDNYEVEISENATLTIEKRLVSVQLVPHSKIHDGTSVAFVESFVNNVKPGDNLKLTFKAYFENGDIGNNKKIDIIDIKLSGANAENYVLSIPRVLYANITRKSITNGKVTITVEDGNTLLGEDVVLVVKELKIDELKFELENKEIHKAYEILLLKNGEEITDFGGELFVRIEGLIPSVKEEMLLVGSDKKPSQIEETIEQKATSFKTEKLGTIVLAVEKNNVLLIALICVGGAGLAVGIVATAIVIAKKQKYKSNK